MDHILRHDITPYSNPLIKERLQDIDAAREIEILNAEIAKINTTKLTFDRWDFIAIFSVGMLEVAADFILGDPRKGLSKNLSDKNHVLGKNIQKIHEELEHSGHPIDYQGPKFGGGSHRARTFGHDLLLFPIAILMLSQGVFIDGYYEGGSFKWIITQFNQYGNKYPKMSLDKAIISYLMHMFADFCSSMSLPVPGFGLLAHMPNRELRQLVDRMYNDGFNMRHMAVQGLPVLSTEILMRIYFYFRYKDSGEPKEASKHKLRQMLLMSHSVALLVNIGKVIITKNITSINLPMIMRVLHLAFSVFKEEMELTHKAKVKAELGVLRGKWKTLETLVILDEALYYTTEIERYIVKDRNEFLFNFEVNEERITTSFDEIDNTLAKFRKLRE